MNPTLFWVVFHLFVFAMLALDLGVFHRKSHVVRSREALAWCGVWVTLALAFNTIVYYWKGSEVALQFLTGYVIEYSLSVDNIFVFILIFAYFKVPSKLQHKVLFWGILGALIMRAAMILAGISLIEKFHWIIYLFGAFLIFSGIKMLLHDDTEIEPEKNPVLKLLRKALPVTRDYVNGKFLARIDGRLFATPLFVVLVMIETTDLVFAVDSIPAILAISHDPFIVYTSNVFAILGLRSLYFALARVVQKFHYLSVGLSFVLIFVGIKMCITDFYHIKTGVSLGVVGGILLLSVIVSMILPDRAKDKPTETADSGAENDTKSPPA